MNKRIQLSIMSIFIAVALIGSVSTLGDSAAFANDAEQEIEQGQASQQNAQCVTGGDTLISCNNFNIQAQANYGNLALAQSR
jgi:hypothetical protein